MIHLTNQYLEHVKDIHIIDHHFEKGFALINSVFYNEPLTQCY